MKTFLNFASKNIAFLLLSLTAMMTAPVSAQERSLSFKEEKRRYIVYTPPSYASSPEKKYPVVLNFHGGGMTMREQMFYTQMNKAADEFGFIVVYPQGVGAVGKQDWNVGFGTSYRDGVDDVGFTEAMLDELEKNWRIDTKRIYATGLSRGGFFVQRLAAELSHKIAAVASVGATLPIPVQKQQSPRAEKKPLGVMVIMGTADQVVAHAGKSEAYLSAEASYEYWIQSNTGKGKESAYESSRVLDHDAKDQTQTKVLEYQLGNQSVSFVSVQDGGHTWPGADAFNIGLPLGKTSKDFDANTLMWQFFQKHRR